MKLNQIVSSAAVIWLLSLKSCMRQIKSIAIVLDV